MPPHAGKRADPPWAQKKLPGAFRTGQSIFHSLRRKATRELEFVFANRLATVLGDKGSQNTSVDFVRNRTGVVVTKRIDDDTGVSRTWTPRTSQIRVVPEAGCHGVVWIRSILLSRKASRVEVLIPDAIAVAIRRVDRFIQWERCCPSGSSIVPRVDIFFL